MLVHIDAFHCFQFLLFFLFQYLPLPRDFRKHHVLLKVLLENLVRVPVALRCFDRFKLVLGQCVLLLLVLLAL